MKSITLIASAVIITFTLIAFTYASKNVKAPEKISCKSAKHIEPPTFSFNLSSQASNTLTKERIHNATTVSDLMPDFGMQENLKNNITSVRDVKIKLEKENDHTSKCKTEKENENSLSKEQISLLHSLDYSSNFYLEGYSFPINENKDVSEERYFNYYMTVVPEQQASYKAGEKSFINFLKTQCQPTIAKVQKGNLKSGKISFIVTKDGSISNIGINSTCGYPSVDERMVDLINKLPDGWNAATNDKGEKVNQTLVFSYGQTGC